MQFWNPGSLSSCLADAAALEDAVDHTLPHPPSKAIAAVPTCTERLAGNTAETIAPAQLACGRIRNSAD